MRAMRVTKTSHAQRFGAVFQWLRRWVGDSGTVRVGGSPAEAAYAIRCALKNLATSGAKIPITISSTPRTGTPAITAV
jgi:hypothetical protein